MDREEILQKSIEKAIKNGWKHLGMQIATKEGPLQWNESNWNTFYESEGYCAQIFSHPFAKAFFGEELITLIEIEKENSQDQIKIKGLRNSIVSRNDNDATIKMLAYLYHLQQMALEEDRISYLAKFL